MPNSKYRVCRIGTPYGDMYLVEIKRLWLFWFELTCVCSLEDASRAISKHSRPRKLNYHFYNKYGIVNYSPEVSNASDNQ